MSGHSLLSIFSRAKEEENLLSFYYNFITKGALMPIQNANEKKSSVFTLSFEKCTFQRKRKKTVDILSFIIASAPEIMEFSSQNLCEPEQKRICSEVFISNSGCVIRRAKWWDFSWISSLSRRSDDSQTSKSD